MAKQKNDNIGHMVCLIDGCQAHAAVRKNRSGKYYFDCPDHGRITPNLPEGQNAILETANIWGANGAPPECARWIAEQWPWPRVTRDPDARKPVNGETPCNGDSPVNEADPVASEPVEQGPGVPPPPPEPAPTPATEHEPEPEESQPEEWEFS